MVAVSLQDLTTSIGRQQVLDGVSAEIADGEFAAVLGPSGTGKSTLLRSIAGLVTPSRGRVDFDGVDITSTKVAERDIGLVFQSPALLPSRNVRRNVEFPLEIRKQTVESIRQRVGAEARATHIEHLLERKPTTLSRGEQQLVQIARTMVRSPRPRSSRRCSATTIRISTRSERRSSDSPRPGSPRSTRTRSRERSARRSSRRKRPPRRRSTRSTSPSTTAMN